MPEMPVHVDVVYERCTVAVDVALLYMLEEVVAVSVTDLDPEVWSVLLIDTNADGDLAAVGEWE